MPSSPTVRLVTLFPPRTLDMPRFLPDGRRAAVLPSVTARMKARTSSRVTAATFIAPKSGRMCLSIRPRSDCNVLTFFGSRRRVSRRPLSASAQYAVTQLCPP